MVLLIPCKVPKKEKGYTVLCIVGGVPNVNRILNDDDDANDDDDGTVTLQL